MGDAGDVPGRSAIDREHWGTIEAARHVAPSAKHHPRRRRGVPPSGVACVLRRLAPSRTPLASQPEIRREPALRHPSDPGERASTDARDVASSPAIGAPAISRVPAPRGRIPGAKLRRAPRRSSTGLGAGNGTSSSTPSNGSSVRSALSKPRSIGSSPRSCSPTSSARPRGAGLGDAGLEGAARASPRDGAGDARPVPGHGDRYAPAMGSSRRSTAPREV